VDSRDTRLRHDDQGRTLVLVTCYPFEAVMPGGPMRYVVTALPEQGQGRL
jgi:sortase A